MILVKLFVCAQTDGHYIHRLSVCFQRFDRATRKVHGPSQGNVIIELCHLYPYPCPKKFYKLPAVLFCYTILFYKLAWAWAWV